MPFCADRTGKGSYDEVATLYPEVLTRSRFWMTACRLDRTVEPARHVLAERSRPMSDISNSHSSSIKTRHILFFDRTRNSPKGNTNVHRLYEMTKDGPVAGGVRQKPVYWEGVGAPGKKLRLSRHPLETPFGLFTWSKVKKGYLYLCKEHRPGDEIFIFGFSRGAFSAMGLAGLLEWRGLPEADTSMGLVKKHIRSYRNAVRDSQEHCDPGGRSLGELMALGEAEKESLPWEDKQVLECFRSVMIEFLGVFDTVRATGAETTWWFPRSIPRNVAVGDHSHTDAKKTLVLRYTRHLPPNVVRAYQALAVDEHRAAFHPRVWVIPKDERKPVGRDVEQRWFIGAHANVGGGYPGDRLSRIPLAWMQIKAGPQYDAAGVELRPGIAFHTKIYPDTTEFNSDRLVDSFREHWHSAGSSTRYKRPIGACNLKPNPAKEPITKRSISRYWIESRHVRITGQRTWRHSFANYKMSVDANPTNVSMIS
jgi:hypothetical protein